MYRTNLPPVTDRIRLLPVQDGYPVPWFVAKVDERYDFRCIDYPKVAIAVKEKRCWVCGQKLGSYLAFVVGPMCSINRTIAEPPSHKDCAEWAIKACPFLLGRQEHRRETSLPEGVQEQPGIAIKRNPKVVALWVTRSYQPFKVDNGVLFKIGEPISVDWFKNGRQATHQECVESIESGYPLLFEVAQANGKLAIKSLEQRKLQALKLLSN